MTKQEELSFWCWTNKAWEPSQWGKRGSEDSYPGGQRESWLVTWPLDLRGCRVSRDWILILQEGMSQGTFDDIFKSNHRMGVNIIAKQVPGKCVYGWKVNKKMRRKSLSSGMRPFQSVQLDVTEHLRRRSWKWTGCRGPAFWGQRPSPRQCCLLKRWLGYLRMSCVTIGPR